MTEALLLSAAIGSANAIAAIMVFRKAYGKEKFADFSKAVLASMTIRLVIMTLIAWICIFFLGIDKFYFSLGLFVTVFISIFVEILFFHNYAKKRKK